MATASLMFRSKYEERVYRNAKADGITIVYEPTKIGFALPIRLGKCTSCGAKNTSTRPSTYIPDFGLKNGSYVEAKGKFTSSNRTRMLGFKAARPDLTVRILFQRDNYLTKKHLKRYTEWAKDNGFECAVGDRIPKDWEK